MNEIRKQKYILEIQCEKKKKKRKQDNLKHWHVKECETEIK